MGPQTRPLISLQPHAAEATRGDNHAAEVETAFLIPGLRALWLNTAGWSNKATSYYAFEVKRDPKNLKTHVQRILHHISLNDSAQLSGALTDLFIVSTDKCQALKKRLLEYSRAVLGENQYQIFKNICSQDICQAISLKEHNPDSRYSVLLEGSYELRPLIEPITEDG
jgi:hypothetical protein